MPSEFPVSSSSSWLKCTITCGSYAACICEISFTYLFCDTGPAWPKLTTNMYPLSFCHSCPFGLYVSLSGDKLIIRGIHSWSVFLQMVTPRCVSCQTLCSLKALWVQTPDLSVSTFTVFCDRTYFRDGFSGWTDHTCSRWLQALLTHPHWPSLHGQCSLHQAARLLHQRSWGLVSPRWSAVQDPLHDRRWNQVLVHVDLSSETSARASRVVREVMVDTWNWRNSWSKPTLSPTGSRWTGSCLPQTSATRSLQPWLTIYSPYLAQTDLRFCYSRGRIHDKT